MIIIIQNKKNLIDVTLTEKKISSTTIYLFEFVDLQTKNKFYTIASDRSNSPNRYNQFCITETFQSSGGTNPFAGQVALQLSGQYYYNIYENPNSVLSPSGLNEVETGRLLVIANKEVINPTYESSVNPKQMVYNPELYLK